MTELTERQAELCEQSETDYSDLKAFFVNCTLKRSPEVSNTQGLMDISIEIMRRNGVEVECIRAVDHEIATGVWPDMTEHGWERDEWPQIFERVMAADILVLLFHPMMPHLAEDCWAALGHKSLVASEPWPRVEPGLLVEDSITLPVQINGRKRDDVTVARNAGESDIQSAVLALESVKRALAGKPPKKVIVVPQRIVNVVA